mmetsp:Transcript_20326/g.38508  ORF Transcript_20326/g.38508 Transcript_20326/m.38508 type:complete len:253 (+) Transcript_20326:147-905(+)
MSSRKDLRNPKAAERKEPPDMNNPLVVNPGPSAVICSRGDVHSKHPGNRQLYQAIDSHMDQYEAAVSRGERARVVHQIKACIPGDFVKRDSSRKNGTYSVLSNKEARQKISHAIRYKLKGRVNASSVKTDKESRPGPSSVSSSDSASTTGAADPDEIFSDNELSSVLIINPYDNQNVDTEPTPFPEEYVHSHVQQPYSYSVPLQTPNMANYEANSSTASHGSLDAPLCYNCGLTHQSGCQCVGPQTTQWFNS